jgi:agmatinase
MTNSPLIINPNDDSESVAVIFGVPFDSTHSYKPGCRFGPDAMRDAFNNIEIFQPEFGVDLETVNINDLGNTKTTVVAAEMLQMVENITSELKKQNKQIIILGGEHLITLGSFTCFPKDTGYVVFDAHYDLRDQYADIKLSHAAFLNEHNIATVSDKEIRNGNGTKLLKDITSTFDSLYLSIDLDVLDPAFAPGVGNPEAVGISSRELYDLITILQNKKIVAADIVELNPTYDNGSTASMAAKLIATIIAMNLSR